MADVISIFNPRPADAPPPVEEVQMLGTATTLTELHRLWSLGLISTVARSIGTQALYLLATSQNRKAQFVSMTVDEMFHRCVSRKGVLLAGPPIPLRQGDIGAALGELHYGCGILNQVDLKFFNQSGSARAHFLSPLPNQKVPHFNDSTKINFRLDKVPVEFFKKSVTDRINAVFANATILEYPED